MAQEHPNKRRFEGVLCGVDQPSDAPPHGSGDHLVVVQSAAAEAALESLLEQPVGFGDCFGIHNYRQRCGIITGAKVVAHEVLVSGILFDRDFPEVAKMIQRGKLGMSFEVDYAKVRNMRAAIYEIYELRFCGAAIVLAEKAAWKSTRISLAATAAADDDNHIVIPSQVSMTIRQISE